MKIPTLEIRSPVRRSLDRILIPILKELSEGSVLDLGAGEKFSSYFKHINNKCKPGYLSADVEPITGADIICYAEEISSKVKEIDNVISIELLEHCEDPQKVVKEIYKVLKPGGKCVLTTRFMYPYHPNPTDCFRFTEDGLLIMFGNAGFSEIKITGHGNRLLFFWEMINSNIYTRTFLNLLSPIIGLFDWKDKKFTMGYVVEAVK